MTINWNRLIPLILFALCGVAMIITGAVIGSSELIVAGTAMTSAATGAAFPSNAITTGGSVLLACFLGGGVLLGCGGASARCEVATKIRQTAETVEQAAQIAEDYACADDVPEIDRVYEPSTGGET